MKFTDGFWQMREGITPAYAVEYIDHEIHGNELTVYTTSKHVAGKGDTQDVCMLTLVLTSPMENVIKVSMSHFATMEKAPFIQVTDTAPQVQITEEEETITYQSGTLRAVVSKVPNNWKIEYFEGEKPLTDTAYRNMAYMKNAVSGKNYMVEQLAIDVNEQIYGLGERFTSVIKNGHVVDMWNEDGGTASEIAYKNIPFYITNKGYGVLVDSYADVSFEVGSEKVERVQFSLEGEHLGYYVIAGTTPMGTIQKYTELTGKPALPPAWSFGLWLTTSFKTSYDEETTTSFLDGMRDREIPLHVFHYDACWMKPFQWCDFLWDPEHTPDPVGKLKRYHDRGLHICVWLNPYVSQKSYLFKEGAEKGYFIKKTDGNVWQTDKWQPGLAIVDFTNLDAVNWWIQKLEALLDLGVDCIKTDFGERIPVKDVVYYDGSDPLKMHNYYTVLYNKAVFEMLTRKRGNGDAVLFSRSSAVGGQQYPVHWGGDCSATYPSMAETLRGGLSLSCAGFGYWSHDIGGFEQTARADVYKRWCAFGLLSTHSRLHGADTYRVPWLFDEESCVVLKKFVNLKCSLMPYIYAQAVRAHEEGRPVMRPMFVEFPEDLTAPYCETQYMFGDSLLAAPVFREDGKVNYYLPAGTWLNYLTGEKLEGEKWITQTYDFLHMPLMVKENSILAVGDREDVPDYDFSENVTFVLSEFKDGAKSSIFVTDMYGKKVREVTAERNGNQIVVTVEGGSDRWNCRMLTGDAVVEKSEGKAVITLL